MRGVMKSTNKKKQEYVNSKNRYKDLRDSLIMY